MTSTIRTYSVGDTLAPELFQRDVALWCDTTHDGWTCALRKGHAGPQHIATTDRTPTVLGVWDRDTSGDPMITEVRLIADDASRTLTLLDGRRVTLPADLYSTARDELHRYTALAAELRAELDQARRELGVETERVVELNRHLAQVREERERLTTERAAMVDKDAVAEVAMRYARRHDWCSVVQQALGELGITAKQRFRIGTKVKFSYGEYDVVVERVVIEVESDKAPSRVYEDVDDMDQDDAVSALNAAGFYLPDGFEFRGFDAETHAELVEED